MMTMTMITVMILLLLRLLLRLLRLMSMEVMTMTRHHGVLHHMFTGAGVRAFHHRAGAGVGAAVLHSGRGPRRRPTRTFHTGIRRHRSVIIIIISISISMMMMIIIIIITTTVIITTTISILPESIPPSAPVGALLQ
jgi:hypothetical protein